MLTRTRSFARRGFTLVELLVTMAVIAVGATLAAPGAMRMIANNRVQNAAQSILDGLNQARAEAVRRNSPVTFTLRADGTGWSITQPSSGDTVRAFSSSDWGAIAIASAGSVEAVTFLPTGLLQTGTQLSEVTVSSAVADAATRRINVYGGGLIRMCDPALTAANDPRRC